MSTTELTVGQELDAAVAERVMGWKEYRLHFPGIVVWYWEGFDPMHAPLKKHPDSSWDKEKAIWSPSTDIAAAWQVVERMRELGWYCTIQQGLVGSLVVFTSQMVNAFMQDAHIQNASTVTETICHAALIVMEGTAQT